MRSLDIFRKADEKILSPRTASVNSFYLDFDKRVFKGTNSFIYSEELDLKYVIGILNSTLANYWYREYGYSYHGGQTKKYEPAKIKQYMIPIYNANEDDQAYIIERVLTILDCMNKKSSKINKFLNWLRYRLRNPNVSAKLLSFYEMNIESFIEELISHRNDLNEDELEIITGKYNTYKSGVNRIISILIRLNTEIDNKVFDLYNITEEERNIITTYTSVNY